MQQMKYTCDHCGKEITINDKGFVDNGYLDMRVDFMNTDKVTGLTDLCFECADNLFGMIKDYLKGGNALE